MTLGKDRKSVVTKFPSLCKVPAMVISSHLLPEVGIIAPDFEVRKSRCKEGDLHKP